MEDTPTPEEPVVALSLALPPLSSPTPPRFNAWMLAGLGCLPLTVLLLFVPEPAVCAVAWIFVTGTGLHSFLRYRRGRSTAIVAVTGAWLLPLISLIAISFAAPNVPPDICCGLLGLCIVGFVGGFIISKQTEAAITLCSILRHRTSREDRRGRTVRELLDEAITPLEAPPGFGLPRRFGIRGLLIVTTWAAILMGGLRACRAYPSAYFVVLSFVAGVVAAQVLLFQGRKPIKASMYAGAFLLPAELLVLFLSSAAPWQSIPPSVYATLLLGAMILAFYVSLGMFFGAIAGFLAGWLYYYSDEFLIWLFRGVPTIAMEPIDDADADVLLSWVTGPKFCRRWAGEQIIWPLDRQQLLDRFAAARDRTVRKIYKAVDVRTGNMVGYAEFGDIDYTSRSASLELPLVDPGASERGRIGVLMLNEMAAQAFDTLDLFSVTITADSDESALVVSCQQACQANFSFEALSSKGDAKWVSTVRRFTPLA
jgi:hypothetical protein